MEKLRRTKKIGGGGRRIAVGLLTAFICLLLLPVYPKAAAPKISSKKISLVVGNTKTLKMKNTKKKVKWTSGKNKVVKVSQKGVVTARKKGSTTVTAKVSGRKYTCRVTVKDAKLSTYRLSLRAGGSKKLKLTNSKGKVKWSSTDRSVVKVSQTGVVAAVKPGTAAVKAKVAASTYQCKVTVKEDGNSTVPGETGTPTGTPGETGTPTGTPGGTGTPTGTPGETGTPTGTPGETGTPTGTPGETGTPTGTPGETGTPTEIPETPAAPPDAEAVTLDFYTAGGGDFICGISQTEVQFALDADTINVKVQILDALDEVVYEQEIPTCRRGETYKVQWDGKKPDGSYVGDTSCYVKIIAGEKESKSDYLTAMSVSDFEGGNGSQANPYQVVTLDHLRKVGQHNKCYFIQTADIDAGYENFTAMFRSDNPFVGTYDGNGKKISNLLIRNTSDGKGTAVFYSVGQDGVLKNMVLSNCTSNLYIEQNVDGYGACLAVENSGNIQKCELENCQVIVNGLGSAGVYGGMVSMKQTVSGVAADCIIRDCAITAKDSVGRVGGISAINEGKIINCTVERLNGTSIGSDQYQFGGIMRARIGGIAAENVSGASIISVKVNGSKLKTQGRGREAGGIAAVNDGSIMGWGWNSSDGELIGDTTGDCCAVNNGLTNP
ncbi:MAG: hypothetical protein HFH57_12550 [Lachnospiraceae bacterium]|nr:hypothetical protein [Lachnospiraceae bacterium]